MKVMSGRKFLLLDDRNIYKLDGARVVVNQPRRHPANPIFSPQQGWWDKSKGQVGWLVNVIRDDQEGIFKAWYSFASIPYFVPGRKVEKPWRQLAYATSTDGIHWERPNLGQVERDGSRQNNLLHAPPVCSIFKDPSEAIPERRYKMAFTPSDQAAEIDFLNRTGIFCPICIAYSPDGIRWTVPRLIYSRTPDPAVNRPTNPVIPEGTDAIDTYAWYWDPYIRRYVGMMRHVWNVPRRICMSESDDFVHWTPRRIIMEPDGKDPPQNREFHGMHTMRYGDYWVGFLQVIHYVHEGWDAYHEIPDDKPWLGTWTIQLTYSRDGRNWLRCGDRQVFMAPSNPGGQEFDSSIILPVQQPFVHDDKIWIYYRGSSARDSHVEHQRKGLNRGTGLMQLRLDGFQLRLDGFVSVVAVSLKKKITDALPIRPTHIRINAETFAGGSIRLGLLDPYDRPIPEFSVDQSIPFQGDETDALVVWKHGRTMDDFPQTRKPGSLRLKFYLDRAKIYAFSLLREEEQ